MVEHCLHKVSLIDPEGSQVLTIAFQNKLYLLNIIFYSTLMLQAVNLLLHKFIFICQSFNYLDQLKQFVFKQINLASIFFNTCECKILQEQEEAQANWNHFCHFHQNVSEWLFLGLDEKTSFMQRWLFIQNLVCTTNDKIKAQ